MAIYFSVDDIQTCTNVHQHEYINFAQNCNWRENFPLLLDLLSSIQTWFKRQICFILTIVMTLSWPFEGSRLYWFCFHNSALCEKRKMENRENFQLCTNIIKHFKSYTLTSSTVCEHLIQILRKKESFITSLHVCW